MRYLFNCQHSGPFKSAIGAIERFVRRKRYEQWSRTAAFEFIVLGGRRAAGMIKSDLGTLSPQWSRPVKKFRSGAASEYRELRRIS